MAKPVETRKLSRGMGRLVRHSASGPWTWQFWECGSWRTRPTGEKNLSHAQQWVIQQELLRTTRPRSQQRRPILFSTVAKEYQRARANGERCARLRPSSLLRLTTALNAFEEFLGSRHATILLHQIDERMIASFLESLAAHVRVDTANGYFAQVARVFKFAAQQKYISDDPTKPVQRLFANGDTDQPDDDAIEGWPCPSAENLKKILEAARARLTLTNKRAFNGSEVGRPVYRGINQNSYYELFYAMALTGIRIGEARYLTWEDVDFSKKVILIRPGRKNGILWQPKTRSSIRRVPIVPELEALLKELREKSRNGQWVFETNRGTQLSEGHPTYRFRTICDGLGFAKRFVLHSLRKYWASTVAAQGMDPLLLIRALGHTDFKLIMSTYYSQNDDARLVAEAQKINFGLKANTTLLDDAKHRQEAR